jgi:hypothetical protein
MYCDIKYFFKKNIQYLNVQLVEGCFSSFPYGTCLLSVSIAYILTNYQYLAFDVSLPPPKNLSCSPKQLDSVLIGLLYIIKNFL